ncbi:MAG: nucleotidyltransferase family protein [Acidobacteria bacterium]|nr:nucleotidyltransferase family protein [Acidobacteriota bacterium]
MNDFEECICAALRGEVRPWSLGPDAVGRLVDFALLHGVLPLLGFALRQQGFEAWPNAVRDACMSAARREAVIELARRAEVMRVLGVLGTAGVTPIILKGSALAYQFYPSPVLRTRSDTDLLVAPRQRRAANAALDLAGYRCLDGVDDDYIQHESAWESTNSTGLTHLIDLHWSTNNALILARLLEYDELAARAVPVPALGPYARAAAPADALFFACIHRAGHAYAPLYLDGAEHDARDRLIWLYDVHLLVSAMSTDALEEFSGRAAERRAKSICLHALREASKRFGTIIPQQIVSALEPDGSPEPSARYLNGNRLRLLADNLAAMDSWADRLRWALQLAMPPAAHMRRKYAGASLRWLPLLYLRRAFNGLARLTTSSEWGR